MLTGVGSCVGSGTTDNTNYFCGKGPNCNNPEGNTCWDPVNNKQADVKCSSSQWQCKVNLLLMRNKFEAAENKNYFTFRPKIPL